MNGKITLYVDQHNTLWMAKTAKELAKKVGGGKISPMYRDNFNGQTVKVGYVIGKLWLNAFKPIEVPVETHRRG